MRARTVAATCQSCEGDRAHARQSGSAIFVLHFKPSAICKSLSLSRVLTHRLTNAQVSSISFAPSSLADVGTSRHFALYKGIPGHLVITEDELLFASMKGFRSLSSKLFKGVSGRATPIGEADKATILFRELMSSITSVKKEARFEIGIFDTDGLQMQFASGKVRELVCIYV